MHCPCSRKASACADTQCKQDDAAAYSHNSSKRPRNSRPMAAGPSLPGGFLTGSGVVVGGEVFQMLLSSHRQTSRVKSSGVLHHVPSSSVTTREILYTPGGTGCRVVRVAEVSEGKQPNESAVEQSVSCSLF